MEAVCNVTASASLKGAISKLKPTSRPVYKFLGIPYAKPPVGSLRFKPPEENSIWQGERDATAFGPICPQNLATAARTYSPFEVPDLVDEDCLYLNVWTPEISKGKKFPVMVWIHGGAFIQGFSNFYDGTALSTYHDVVFVSINYRLGPFGFLCTSNRAVRGNMGLLDQLQALKWVKRYISSFGGDPENVTIFGESAGGISASMHLLSPLSTGLFKRAICESGVSTHPGSVWTVSQAAKYLQKRIAKMEPDLDPNQLSSKTILEILKKKSSDDILKGLGDGFSPVLDGYYLPDWPKRLYARNEFQCKDIMFGFNSHEGAQFVFSMTGTTKVPNKILAKQFLERVVKIMFYRGNPNCDKLINALMDFYLDDVAVDDGEGITKALVDMYGDLLFVAPTVEVADHHASHQGKIFMYQFNERPSYSGHPDWVMADHGHEIIYVLGVPFMDRFPDIWSEEEKRLSQQIMSLWTSFATNGDPKASGITSWPEYESTKQQYINLEGNVSVGSKVMSERVKFWNEHMASLATQTSSSVATPTKSKY